MKSPVVAGRLSLRLVVAGSPVSRPYYACLVFGDSCTSSSFFLSYGLAAVCGDSDLALALLAKLQGSVCQNPCFHPLSYNPGTSGSALLTLNVGV